MKNVILVLFSIFAFFLSACQKEETQNIVSEEESRNISDEEANKFIEMINNIPVTRDEEIEKKIMKETDVISSKVMNINEGEELIIIIEIYVNSNFENTANLVDKYVNEVKQKYKESIIEIKVMSEKETLLEETF